MNAVEQSFDVYFQHPVPLIRVLSGYFAKQHHAGIVDDSVGGTKLCFRFLNGGQKCLAVGNVNRFAERVRQVELFHRVQSARQKQQWMTAMGKHFAAARPMPELAPVIMTSGSFSLFKDI